MHKFHSILLVADPDARRTPAFERARDLALKSGAHLHLCLNAYSRSIAAAGLLSRRAAAAARGAYTQERERLLEQEAASLRELGLRVTTEVAWSAQPALDILRQVAEEKPDLVIKDAGEGAGYLGARLDDLLLRRCPAPVLLIHPGSSRAPRRIAAAIDTDRRRNADTAFNNLIVHTAAWLATADGAELHLLHAEQRLVLPAAPMRHGHPIRGRAVPALPRSRFEGFAGIHHVPAERCHRLPGAAVEALSAFVAAQRIDLLVLGTEPRPLLQRLRRGNKIERINRYVSCDVLALKPPRLWARERVHSRAAPGAAAVSGRSRA